MKTVFFVLLTFYLIGFLLSLIEVFLEVFVLRAYRTWDQVWWEFVAAVLWPLYIG